MIKIINGRRYNTDTATSVFFRDNGHFVADFSHRSKQLFRTKNGVWFIHHQGGAMSDMAQYYGKNLGGSESIEPIDDEDAFGFLQSHSDDDDAQAAIVTYFADRVIDA